MFTGGSKEQLFSTLRDFVNDVFMSASDVSSYPSGAWMWMW